MKTQLFIRVFLNIVVLVFLLNMRQLIFADGVEEQDFENNRRHDYTAFIGCKDNRIIFKKEGKEVAVWYYSDNYRVLKLGQEINGIVKFEIDDCMIFYYGSHPACWAFIGFKKNKINDNKIIWYFKTGEKNAELHYTDGVLNGPYRKYYRNGKVDESGVFINGERNGMVRSFREDGSLYMDIPYEHNNKNGTGQKYDNNGEFDGEVKFNNGKMHDLYRNTTVNFDYQPRYLFEGSHKEIFPDELVNNYSDKFNRHFYKGSSIKALEIDDNWCFVKNYKVIGSCFKGVTEGFDIKSLSGKIDTIALNDYLNAFAYYTGVYKDGIIDDGIVKKIYFTIADDDYETVSYKAGKTDGPNVQYKKGKLILQANYAQGLLDGEYKRFDKDGNLLFSGLFSEGKKNGLFIEGKPGEYNYTTYKNDLENGEYRYEYYDVNTGKEIYLYSLNYENGVLNGYFREKSNGQIINELFLKDGEMDADEEEIKRFKEKLPDSFGCVNCAAVGVNKMNLTLFFDESNYIGKRINRSEGSVDMFKEKLNGKVRVFDMNGILIEEEDYVDGKKDGKRIVLYQSGVKFRETDYINNLKEGTDTIYYPSGKVYRQIEYSEDKLNGDLFQYDEIGTLFIKEKYKDGYYIGPTIYYDKEGNLWKIENYMKYKAELPKFSYSVSHRWGSYFSEKPDFSYADNIPNTGIRKKEGECQEFYSDGVLKETVVYKNDIREGKYFVYYKNGAINIRGMYSGGKKNETFTYYKENGKVDKEETYKKGKNDGRFVWYDNSGRIYKEEIYSDGKLKSLIKRNSFGFIIKKEVHKINKN
jgi:antitoxin component YwqK of YwqJK toxin-antitoxin module